MPNYASCEQYGPIIAEQLHERIKNGSMELVGKIGEVDPPHLVMPLVVVSQRDKIRLCHDERQLNLFMVHKPFTLEGLAQIPAMLCQGDKIASSDEKSAYDGVLISPRSRTFFGLWRLVLTISHSTIWKEYISLHLSIYWHATYVIFEISWYKNYPVFGRPFLRPLFVTE